MSKGEWRVVRTPSAGVVAAMVLAGWSVVGGCASDPNDGYALGTATSFDRDVRTVYVPVFQNETFVKGIEWELTDAVVKEIQRQTPWRVTSEKSADTVLEATITQAELRKLTEQRDSGVVQEQAVLMRVNFQFRDARTGEVRVGRERFEAADTFVPANPVKERIETGENLVIQRLARDIVNELRSEW